MDAGPGIDGELTRRESKSPQETLPSTASNFLQCCQDHSTGKNSPLILVLDHGTPTGKYVKLDPYLTPYVKPNSKSNTQA